MEIIDTHHHLWNLDVLHYPWLVDKDRQASYGDYSAIRRNHLARDFRADMGSQPIRKSVHIEAGHDHADPAMESKWLQMVSDEEDSDGFPHAIVAYADLSGENAPLILDRHLEFRNVRGIRQMLHEPGAAHCLGDKTWRRNVASLAKRGLSFDLQIHPRQAEEAMEVISKNPDLTFILNHAGGPPRMLNPGGSWASSVTLLATAPNVFVKLSGFGTSNAAWNVNSIGPIIDFTVSAFGPERSMFGSNYPVESLTRPYWDIWSAFLECTASYGADQREQLFNRTAATVYRI